MRERDEDILRAAKADDAVGRLLLLCGVLSLIAAAVSLDNRVHAILCGAGGVAFSLSAAVFFKLSEVRLRLLPPESET